ncbi:MAG: histidine kinase [Pseudomonadota bacterium]
MDLRRRLVGYLGAMLLGLLVTALAVDLLSLRGEVRAEVAASEHLAGVLLDLAGIDPGLAPEEAAARAAAILRRAPLRHISLRLDDGAFSAAPEPVAGRLAALLGAGMGPGPGQAVRVGRHLLRIAPNPASEIEERLYDTVRFWITLLFISGATMLVAWRAADRALAPVRELEAGLTRLAAGAADAALPDFALREFRRVAGAIDTLAAALAQARAEQRRLSHQLIRVQEDERRALALELHDEMGQTLTAIGVTATYLKRNAERLQPAHIDECAQELRRDVRTSGVQLRAMLQRLRPHGLDGDGLGGALRELVAGWQQRALDIAFTLQMPQRLPPLGDEAALVLYRVLQEALTNVVRHSGASSCRVTLTVEEEELRLRVADDGRGLPAAGPARRGGLLGIEERLRMVGGTLASANLALAGLELEILLPLRVGEEAT